MSSSLTFEVTGNTGAFVFPEFASLPFFTLLDGFMVELFNEDGEPAEFGKNRTLRFSGHP